MTWRRTWAFEKRTSRLAAALAVMMMALEIPDSHWVPAATDWTTDHWPDAQRWKELPPMQFHWPSSAGHGVPAAKVEPGAAGGLGALTGSSTIGSGCSAGVSTIGVGVAAGEEGAGASTTGAGSALGVGAGVLGFGATVIKTPPGSGAVFSTGGGDSLIGAVPGTLVPQLPTGLCWAKEPRCSTD